MKTNRIISTLLAVVMLMSAFVMTVGAADTTAEETTKYTYNTSNAKPSMDYYKGTTYIEPENEGDVPPPGVDVDSPDEKLATMDLRLEKDGYQLYVDAYSGEIAIKKIATGDTMFSNPYDSGKAKTSNGESISKAVKEQLLSQLVVKFTNISTGLPTEYHSFSEAIQGEDEKISSYPQSQINVKNIKNGIRVEYSIGREESRLLLPRQIEKTAFETRILAVIEESLAEEGGVNNFNYKKILGSYLLFDPAAVTSAEALSTMQRQYPITKKMAIYVFDKNISTRDTNLCESIIKTYCPSYTYEDLDEHHMQTEYESEDTNPPLFRMALEYTLDENGLSVRLPANGIRFNESLYRLDSIDILPYMGAGKNPNSGETFFPDGSGTLFDFEEVAASGQSLNIKGKVYGPDFAYHTITEQKQRETIRYPVFGITETIAYSEVIDGVAGMTERDRGYIAIVEEGETMMDIQAYHAVKNHPYNTVRMSVYPRPQDSYNISDSISVGSNEKWTVVSSRKFTGSYRVRYIMLTDDGVAARNNITDYYTCDYVGMAKAYREYLEKEKVLTRLTENDVKEDIPLYINTFGSVPTTKKILSVPVKTMEALTTFEDVQTMYNDFAAQDIKNINFILSGYTKGGLEKGEYPNRVRWEKSVGGKSGFEELMSFANENGVGIFPDFEFAFLNANTLFDGVTLKKHAVKTIDDRYSSKRVYSSTRQSYMSYFELAISPSVFKGFYEDFTEDYLEYSPNGISVSSLGEYLVSDFDEDDPYNRDDSKNFVIDAFAHFDENYNSVMTSGGNAYSWKYVDHITDVAFDSSRYAQASASIPFLGMVLHGYVQIAGTPINMEANIDYAMLKAIENGAALNFTLSYKNTSLLKEDESYSKNYSIRYDIWFDDVVEMYHELNSALKDVQTSLIVDHEFKAGVRVPDNDELLADANAELEARVEFAETFASIESDEERAKLLEARKMIPEAREKLAEVVNGEENLARYNRFVEILAEIDTSIEKYLDASEALKKTRLNALVRDIKNKLYAQADYVLNPANEAINYYNSACEALEYFKDNTGSELDGLKAELTQIVVAMETDYNKALAWKNKVETEVATIYNEVKDFEGINLKPYEYVPTEQPGAGNNGSGSDNTNGQSNASNKYESDKNKIAVVTYSNGTIFVLNFNNYAVSTEVNGQTYTIAAYGYVILKK